MNKIIFDSHKVSRGYNNNIILNNSLKVLLHTEMHMDGPGLTKLAIMHSHLVSRVQPLLIAC